MPRSIDALHCHTPAASVTLLIADASVHSQENGYDFVVIYDNGIEVNRITGSQLPAPIRTSSLLTVRPLLGPKAALAALMPREGPLRVSRFVNETCLQVALTSDGSLQRRGFSANFAPTVRAFTEAALLVLLSWLLAPPLMLSLSEVVGSRLFSRCHPLRAG